jgi:hypothetical protein
MPANHTIETAVAHVTFPPKLVPRILLKLFGNHPTSI